MKRLYVLLLMAVCLMLSVACGATKGDFPPPPDSAIFVNDFAGVLKPDQVKVMNDSLSAYSRRTTNQIVVVTVKDLGDYNPLMYATELGNYWGVGQKELDNGVIILIKPKTKDSKGKFVICTGRGLEGALPDETCTRIIEKKAIPHLKNNNDYDAALWAVLKEVMHYLPNFHR